MPTNSLEYQRKNYKKYYGTPQAKKDRAARNTARNRAEAAGKVKKGDGKEIHHRNGKPTDNNKKNLAVVSMEYNRRDGAKKANKNKGSGYKKKPNC